MSDIDLDELLRDLEHFGTYQKINYLLLSLLVIFSVFPMSYIFTTRDLKYRCFIEECDQINSVYKADWLKYALPHKNNVPSKCERFVVNAEFEVNQTCSADLFDVNQTILCNRFVYETPDITVGRDFNITCDNNLWMLTIVGTMSNIGELFSSPLSGYVSDRYGRKTLMIAAVLWTTFAGLIRSFTPSYLLFAIMEFLDTLLGAGFYGAGFVLAMELVTPEQRVWGNTILACAFAAGEVILGLVAWASQSWRVMLRTLYGPGLFFITYIWLTHESIRWLLSKGRYQEAKKILKRVTKVNGTEISEETITKLNKIKDDPKEESIWHIFRSTRLLLRLANCSFSWICCTFVYYGLTLHSVSISGRIGRRFTLAPSYILSGIACLSFIFVPDDNTNLKLLLFLLGKFFVTISYTVLYMYTTEMFPTNLRHSLLATCSMFGRFGSMVAPQIPLLVRVWDSLPLFLFSVMACSSGLLCLLFPETNNAKLPDTIEEAEALGRKNETT
ncbi:hypothetical protein Trydic_g19283 [Trypoxylus dichotomus]